MFLQVPLAWSQCLGVFGVGLALNIVGIFLLFGLRVRHDYAVVSQPLSLLWSPCGATVGRG